ncbi:GDP-mannose 4,6-dehydratase [Lysobacter sp. M2-1]|uniref:GDP-mannose 4,6-dehydratase n=1 Tax=Lysobacter sp. M2-1 TaxID=2916839 RepID=UPI001F5A8B81|nr:GDP-mannose 4,6-dehydratase [Lysobacter sp. M2-1]
MATILISGIGGQDGSYLAEQSLAAGHRVVGLLRTGRASRAPENVECVEWDFVSKEGLRAVLRDVRPAHFYNLAAFSTGAGMYDDAVAIGELNGVAVARMLQAIVDVDPEIRFCQASSSEMFGDPIVVPQTEATPFRPLSPYAAAKLFAHTVVNSFRMHRCVFACSAILYNHESPRRGPAFVTRKIVDAVARVRAGDTGKLLLGDLDAQRDWGYAPDYVRAMRLMLAHDRPCDYVVATGELHSVREFCELAFSHAGLDWREWVEGGAADVRQDRRGPRVGDATKLRNTLGWRPETDFGTLVRIMVDAAIASTDARMTT